jgi:uncharacterized protein (DUF1697 family)
MRSWLIGRRAYGPPPGTGKTVAAPDPPGSGTSVVGVTRYVALLRGVNVGGITVKSAALAEMARSIGLADVRTVLASGNLLFSAGDDEQPAALEARIEAALREKFGYDAWIVLTTVDHLRAVIDAFPFPERDERQPYVVFGSDQVVLDEIVGAAGDLDPDDERIARGDGVVYWDCPKGRTLDTPFAKLIGKTRHKATTTNRNLRTLRKLV